MSQDSARKSEAEKDSHHVEEAHPGPLPTRTGTPEYPLTAAHRLSLSQCLPLVLCTLALSREHSLVDYALFRFTFRESRRVERCGGSHASMR